MESATASARIARPDGNGWCAFCANQLRPRLVPIGAAQVPAANAAAALALYPHGLLGLHVLAASQALVEVLVVNRYRLRDLSALARADEVFHEPSI